MRLEDLAIRAASRSAEATAVVGRGETMTYGALHASADRVAAALFELGVQRGDRVAVWAPKSARLVAAMQGTLRCGAAYVPIDPRSPRAAVERILADCAVKALVATESTLLSLGER